MTDSPTLDRFRPALWFAALAVLIVAIEHGVTRQPTFAQRPVLPLAVLFDVVVFLPGLFYFLVVRRYRLPLGTVAAAVGACLTLAYWLIPAAQMPSLRVLHLLPAILEGITLLALATKARNLVRGYKAARAHEPQVLPRFRMAVEQALGTAGIVLVAEIDMLRFALLGWWARPAASLQATTFSNYRESGFTALVVVGCFALLIETGTVHLLARHWSPTAAFWLLLADLYAVLLLIAHGHAVRLLPTLLTADEVVIRVGFFWQLRASRATLLTAESLAGDLANAPDTLNLAKPLFTAPNLLLTFAGPVTVNGPYGIRRSARRLALYLDHPQPFLLALLPSYPPTLIP